MHVVNYYVEHIIHAVHRNNGQIFGQTSIHIRVWCMVDACAENVHTL